MDRNRMRSGFAAWAVVLLAGCAGVDIVPITPEEAAGVHRPGAPEGYIVYAPVVVVEVKADGKGNCALGKTIVLPDYQRPYRVRTRSGFGKSGVEVNVQDGWLLTRVKDSSDNKAVLSAITSTVRAESVASACPPPGLYRLTMTPAQQPGQRTPPTLQRLQWR